MTGRHVRQFKPSTFIGDSVVGMRHYQNLSIHPLHGAGYGSGLGQRNHLVVICAAAPKANVRPKSPSPNNNDVAILAARNMH